MSTENNTQPEHKKREASNSQPDSDITLDCVAHWSEFCKEKENAVIVRLVTVCWLNFNIRANGKCNNKYIKDTHKEKAPSNKTLKLTKSTNMGICIVGTST